MASFPLLNTGVVCQHPIKIVNQQAVEVLRFIDGSDQRFLRQGRQFRRWEIRLDLLNESELSTLEDFFVGQLGDYSKFDFLDPLSNTLIPNCVLGNPSILTGWDDVGRGATSLWVVETNA